jgi:dihydroorotase
MLVRNATLADGRVRDVRVRDGQVDAVAPGLTPDSDEQLLDADGDLLLPGVIDVHVHFREPGYAHKETWTTGSRSAAAGGVTTVVDQPNTDPATVTGESFDAKTDLAEASLVNWGVNGGVTPDWDPDSLFSRPLFALGEVFLADSTGDMGIDAALFREAVERATEEGVTVTVHAEDADRFDEEALAAAEADEGVGHDADADLWSAYRTPEAEAAAVKRAVAVAEDADARIHVAHTSTPEGVDAASDAGMSCEVTPHHLFLSREELDDLGTYGRMNPPLRDEERRDALWERVVDGTVEMVATDHAPHTRAEKETTLLDAPSGVPGVETMLPLLLERARRGELGYERVRDLTATTPAAVFDLPANGRVEAGADADLVLVDPEASREIRGEDLHSSCDWTPFEGKRGVFPRLTMVGGRVVYENGEAGERFADEAVGENVRE